MQQRTLGALGPISAITLGGGGLGQVYGATDRAEAVATAREAVDSGVTFLDVAPTYGAGEAERVMGEAFEGRLPDGVRIATKRFIDMYPEPSEVPGLLERSLTESLERLRLERVDLFFLHGLMIPDEVEQPSREGPYRGQKRSLFVEEIRPALDWMVRDGRVGAWGMTAVGYPRALLQCFEEEPRPAAVQIITNVYDAPGNMHVFDEPSRARELIAAANAHNIGVFGIRAVAAGALTEVLDRSLDPGRPEARDYARAAPFRSLAQELGESPTMLAYRYAFSMKGVASIIVGVKNRAELRDCIAAEAHGPLEPDILARIDAVARDGAPGTA